MTSQVAIDSGVELQAGDVLDGKFRIERLIGRSGMGVVYLAKHLELESRVAIKLLLSSSDANDEALARFRREAKLLAKIQSPHVVRVLDIGALPDKSPYLVMEYLDGEDLEQILAREGRLPLARACGYALEAAKGLAAAHAQGIVHRDIKPSNLFVARTPSGGEAVKLIDFGVAKFDPTIAASTAITHSKALLGSPRYMSPEQVHGSKTIDARSDIWSLAITLYEALTGTPVFNATAVPYLFVCIVTQAIPALSSVLEGAPPGIENALKRALERDLSARTADVVTFARELAQFAEKSVTLDVPKPAKPSVTEAVVRVDDAIDGSQTTRILSKETSLGYTASVRHSLPVEPNAFIGREADLRSLSGQIAAGARLVTVLGIGGTGKTRLVTHYGWSSRSEWPGGVWFCDLSDARSVEGIAVVVAGALNVALGKDDPIALLGTSLAGRDRCLVILDNFEQVARDAAATLGVWLERAPNARFIVTSREVLGLPEERTLPLAPLANDEAVRLFVDRAVANKPDFALTEGDRPRVEELVRLLDNLPLAIELAAARMRVMGPAVVLERMKERFKLLVAPGGRRTRQATMRGAIDWSWELLSSDERAALAQLSVFEGGFTLEAAEAVLSLDALWPVDAVQALLDKSLVRTISDDRFALLVSVQEYAAEKLDSSSSRPDAEARHGAYFASFGEADALESLDRHGGVERRKALAQNLDNLAAASRRAIDRADASVAVRTAVAAWAVLMLRGPTHTGLALLEAVEPLAEPLTELRQSLALALGFAHHGVGDAQAAHEEYAIALTICRARGDRRTEGIVEEHIARIHYEQGLLEEANERNLVAVVIHRETGNRLGEAIAIANLGNIDVSRGRFEDARTEYEAALELHREVGNRRFEGTALANLGIIDAMQGRPEEALDHLEKAVTIHREVGNRRSEGMVLFNIAELHERHGRLNEALAVYEQALAIHREVGNRRFEGMVLAALGFNHAAQGREEEARASLLAAETLLRESADREALGKLLARLAFRNVRGDQALALTQLSEAESIVALTGAGPDSEIVQLVELAQAALA